VDSVLRPAAPAPEHMEAALIWAQLAHQTARTPKQRRVAMAHLEWLQRVQAERQSGPFA
jgi:hypothetical protein